MLGLAIDLIPPEGVDVELFAMAARKYFDRVIPYPGRGFVHCQLNVEE